MSSLKFDLNESGVRELMQSNEMINVLDEYAQGVIRKCSGNYETSSYVGKTRANVSVVTSDEKTFFKNLNDNEVLKALW